MQHPTRTPPNGFEALDIGVHLHGSTLLQAIALHLAPGQVGVTLDPNGADKSTLLNVLGSLLRPQTGAG